MFVRCVRATVTVLVLSWAGCAGAQDRPAESPAFSSHSFSDDSYFADPDESFVVEHSGQVAAVAPRRETARSPRCREYRTDEDDGYGRGLACPQPDGSWRIVSGETALIGPRGRDQLARNRAPNSGYPEYPDDPDYADEPHVYEQDARRTRRFRLDWDAWRSTRRGPRSFRDRYDE